MHDELRFIWDVSPIGLAKVARDGKFLAVNPRFAEMVGYSETELLARTYQQITHPDDLAPDISEAEHLSANPDERSYQMVNRYISKDGRTVWINLYVHAICDSKDTFSQFFVFASELAPISIYASNPTKSEIKGDAKISILTYLKNNPKEAIIVCSALIIFIKGGIYELLKTVLNR